MTTRIAAAALAVAFLGLQTLPGLAQTQNALNYRLLSQQDASALPSQGGALGMDIVSGTHIDDAGLSFEMLRIKGVRVGTPGAQAGFHAGDQIVAADGRVFPTLQAFAAYVRSLPPGKLMSVDYIPNNGGPQQAQRIGVTVGSGGRAVAPAQADSAPEHEGLSTGTKIAIGVGAAALFGCYEMGCFSHKQPVAARQPMPAQGQVPVQQTPQSGFVPQR